MTTDRVPLVAAAVVVFAVRGANIDDLAVLEEQEEDGAVAGVDATLCLQLVVLF